MKKLPEMSRDEQIHKMNEEINKIMSQNLPELSEEEEAELDHEGGYFDDYPVSTNEDYDYDFEENDLEEN